MQYIDSARFVASWLSNLVNNLAEGIHRIKCKYGHDYKKWEKMRMKYKNCKYFFEYPNFNDLIKYKRFCSNKIYQKFDENLIHTNLLTMMSISLFY